jgi:CBS domain containing-hemolysin-like protein
MWMVTISLEGVLSIKYKKVKRIYTPMNRVDSIMADTILDEDMVARTFGYRYSRIPILLYYDDRNTDVGVCGIILTKLINITTISFPNCYHTFPFLHLAN